MPCQAQKLDASLLDLCKHHLFAPSSRLPIVVRLQHGQSAALRAEIARLGGMVRYDLAELDAIAAYLTIDGVAELSERPDVESLVLDQQYTVA